MYTISKRFSFSASHQLSALPPDHPCSRLHGHNYEVEIVLSNADLDETGFVVDYGRLEPLQRLVAQQLDHRHLNDVMPAQPSAENIAKWIFDRCVENFDRPIAEMIVAIRVSETHKTYAEFRRH